MAVPHAVIAVRERPSKDEADYKIGVLFFRFVKSNGASAPSQLCCPLCDH